VTIGILVLGMIGTPEVVQHAALAPLAMPVPACAAEMICAIAARFDETYVPKWVGPWTAFTYLHPIIAEASMNNFYLFRVPEYVSAIAEARDGLAAAAAAAAPTAAPAA
jgi:hypothetical protein